MKTAPEMDVVLSTGGPRESLDGAHDDYRQLPDKKESRKFLTKICLAAWSAFSEYPANIL
jgi:hypothetical protein